MRFHLSRLGLSATLLLTLTLACLGATVIAGETPATPVALGLDELAVLSQAVVVVRAGAFSPLPTGGGSVAMWVVKSLKGTLIGGRNIVWISRQELPKAERGSYWLLFLSSMPDGSWRVQTGGSEKNSIELKTLDAPVIAQVSKFVGSYGPPPEPEPPTSGELDELMHKGARGSQEARAAAIAKILSYGDAVRGELLAAQSNSEREIATLARTLLPLLGGGHVVNDLRLVLEPSAAEFKTSMAKNITLRLANVGSEELKVVTGTLEFGDNFDASAAYEVRALTPLPSQAILPTVLPQAYGVPLENMVPLPLLRIVPRFGTLPLAETLRVTQESIAGKNVFRLNFPHGHIDLPGPGKYGLRVKFDCPGPLPTQQGLLEQNFWRGGQLVSNEIILTVLDE